MNKPTDYLDDETHLSMEVDEWKAKYEEFMNSHIHVTAFGPTGPPIPLDAPGPHAHDHAMPDGLQLVDEPEHLRRRKQHWFALGQVAYAHHLEGPTSRVLGTLELVAEAYGELLDSRQTTHGTGPHLSTENQITGLLAQAKKLSEGGY